MTRKQVQKDGTPVFDLTLRYESTYFDYFDPQYGGNISEILWSRDEPYSYGYAFDYDAHSRVTDALYMYDENNIPGCCSEEGITYDKNGNLLTLYRYDDNGEIADIRNTYSGNHLTGNTYDAAGNVTYDRSSGLSYQWNHLNLIKNISEPDMCLVNYSYLADVTKFSALNDEGRGLEYHGSLTFRKVGASRQVESREFSCGSIYIMLGTSTPFVPFYYVKDYLGSVRAVVDGRSGEVVEANDYYAFGSRWETISSSGTISNRYRFNGKENQEGEFGVPTLDYGARHYSATSARWLSMDPLAEKYYGVSPYAFCNNDPVNFVDLDGAAWGKAVKVVKKVYKTVKTGNKLSVKNILKSEVLDIADNVHTLFDSDASGFEKGITAFDLATGFGDEAKWLAKTVGISDGIVDGARVVDGVKFKSFTYNNFRDNLGRLTGGIPDGMQAHHTLPYKFEKYFSNIGINIHDPKYGVWLDRKLHNKLSAEYNKAWEKFFHANPSYTEEQVMEHSKKLMNEIFGQ